ncbi:TPA: class Ib ribonucleoside-diphosphate reductase assembly flavoprotein NrdI, partial [Enterococcus faecium]|nr:class Ib ribonucleoside-diphosphate reductase assembly flavoprotein NrdI [Enterococcus faecium]
YELRGTPSDVTRVYQILAEKNK